MKNGHQLGIGFYGPYLLIFLLIIIIILIYFLIRRRHSPNLISIELLKILKTKYASGDITVDEYLDMKNLIEENKIDNDSILKLIKGELSYEEFKKSN